MTTAADASQKRQKRIDNRKNAKKNQKMIKLQKKLERSERKRRNLKEELEVQKRRDEQLRTSEYQMLCEGCKTILERKERGFEIYEKTVLGQRTLTAFRKLEKKEKAAKERLNHNRDIEEFYELSKESEKELKEIIGELEDELEYIGKLKKRLAANCREGEKFYFLGLKLHEDQNLRRRLGVAQEVPSSGFVSFLEDFYVKGTELAIIEEEVNKMILE